MIGIGATVVTGSAVMKRRGSLLFVLLSITAVSATRRPGQPESAVAQPPNIVLIFADDLGYGDVGCYGAKGYQTPHIDRLAQQGIRFTDFYVAQAVCSASRAALLTGCYPNRLGILGALGPNATHGIHAAEETIAEVLKRRGYATAIYGKWHLGHHEPFLPTRHGFDDYFGLPYSNDMWPHHPTTKFPDLPLIDHDQVVAFNPDQRNLTTWYTERALKFIDQNRDRPFFLYLPQSMPHVPLFVSEKHQGQSSRGLYGDVIMEIDWSVGQLLAALEKHQIAGRTLVVFTSDNGPWLSYGDHAGSAGPLREGKGTTFEGGVRVPCVMRWPGSIPAGTVCREPVMTIDLLPTFARIAGAALPSDRVVDGRDIGPLMVGTPGARSPHESLCFFWDRELQAIRSGPWKLHFPHAYPSPGDPPGADGQPGPYAQRQIELALFNLDADIAETTNVADEHPELVDQLKRLAQEARDDLGDSATNHPGKNVRQPGRI
jgi:arylsulfatase A-like enzyme